MSLTWKIARRDLNPRLRGLRLLFLCLFLGVATLATIGSLTAAMTDELAKRGREILGGDVEVAMSQRKAPEEAMTVFRGLGRVSETIRLRAMAQRTSGGAGPQAVLTELKAVDGAYPLYGKLILQRRSDIGALPASDILIDESLAKRLGLRIGDPLRYGEAQFRIRDIIVEEPDRVGEGFTLGPVALVSIEGLDRTQLIQPGSMFTSKYRIRMPAGANARTAATRLTRAFPASGWQVKHRDNAAPGTSRFFERMGQFLSLIGLTALVVAGIGVSNGVSSYLALKQEGIATLKVLGATSAVVARIYMTQIGIVAALAIFCGLAAGVFLPLALLYFIGDLLPVQPGLTVHPLPLATSAAYGFLIALIFTVPPLARARRLPPAALFRSVVEQRHWRDLPSWLVVGLAAAAVLLLAIGTADLPLFAASVLGATAGVLVLLTLVGTGIRRLAARLPSPKRPLLRLALASLHRPGAQTVPLVIALGLGLTLFVTLAAIQTSLDNEIRTSVPERAPNQFVLDIPSTEQARFRSLVSAAAPGAQVNLVATLQGTITAYGTRRMADLKGPDDARFLRGERGVTYSDVLPQGSVLVAGRWWPKDYQGEPLVSLDRNAAQRLGIGVGDPITVSVLGREIEARIASLRQVNWETMGFNYIMVFSPNALQDAPHKLSATISMDPSREAAVSRALLTAFPSISVIDVGEVIAEVRNMLDQMSIAISLAGSVTILAGIAVLVGAIAAARQARSYDSVILKTLGATRAHILAAQGLEYALLAALLALLAFAIGVGAAWIVIVQVFEFSWAPNWPLVFGTLAAGAVVTLVIGLIGSIPIISIRPASALRRLQLS